MNAEQELREDLRARERALDPDRSFIVQAPAGSGKTELLIQRFLRLLACVDEPEEVLAITFTNKAAAEMRLRVMAALQRGRDDSEPGAPHERLTWTLARDVLARDADRGWSLTANPSRLRVQTLDSLNAAIARMQPLTVSSGTAGAGIPGDAGREALYREAAAATLDYLDSDDWRQPVLDVLTHLDNDARRYIDYLAEMLVARDQWLPLVGGGLMDDAQAQSARAALESNLAVRVNARLAAIRNALPEACLSELIALARYSAENLVADERESPICALAETDDLPDVSDRRGWLGIAELLLTAGDKPAARKRVTVTQGFPAGKGEPADWKQRYADLLESLQSSGDFIELLAEVRVLPESTYSDEQWQVLRSLLNLLQLASAELRTLFRNRAAVDYTEVALTARAALGDDDNPGDIALLLDYRLSHILVDEMQDTSLAQYQMLERLTAGWQAGDGRTLFCVGDPMQSIYRFRNAEVAQFLVAQDSGIGDVSLERLTLRRNFRSGEYLVDWFNQSFDSIMAEHDDADSGAVSYASSIAAEHLQGQGALEVHPVLGSSERHEAETSCRLAKSLLDEHPEDSVAILVRGRGQLRELVPMLRRQHIDFRAVDIDRLTDLPEIIDLLALTRASNHAGDRHAWLAVLRAPWIGLDWQDLLALVRGNASTPVPRLLADPERLDRLSPTGRARIERHRAVLHTLATGSRTESLRSLVERSWLKLGGATWLEDASLASNVYRYLDVLSAIEEGSAALDIATLEKQLDSEKVSTVSDARLQIMTMHKSKGLQFGHVILHGLGRKPRSDRGRVLNWLDNPSPDGGRNLVLSPIGRSDVVEKDPIHNYINRVNRQKSDFERQRLLYVACTRAETSLHLVAHAAVRDDSVARPVPSSLLALLWPAIGRRFEQALEAGADVRDADHAVEWLEPVLHRLAEHWSPPEPASLPIEPPASPSDEQAVEYYWAGSDAKTAGTLVHRWLQGIVDGHLREAARHEQDRRAVTGRWLRELGFDSDAAAPVERRVEQALSVVQEDDRGRWLLGGEGHAELALTGVVDGIVQTGIIDRVRIEGEQHWIVDYKTSTHEGGNRAFFLQEEVRRYRDQLSRYVTLYAAWSGVQPKAALYFPLLAEFVEVDDL